MCSKHYFHANIQSHPPCTIPGCGKPQYAKGFCSAHHNRNKRNGHPLGGRHSHNAAAQWLLNHVGHEGDKCLIWPFIRNKAGYAIAGFEGRTRIASEVMCTLAHGEKPSPDHDAAHSCGNGCGGCVHPQHLRWATRAENEADKVEHGTSNRGERCGTSKLTESDVLAIRAAKGIILQRDLSRLYGVTQGTISQIQHLRKWAWL